MKEKIPEKTVSIIVPVYNAQNFLKKCVDSILTQTFHRLEVILVDDGAQDDSPRMCDACLLYTSVSLKAFPSGRICCSWPG